MLAILNSLNSHNLPIFQLILMILVSKFVIHRALSDKTYLSLELMSPLNMQIPKKILCYNTQYNGVFTYHGKCCSFLHQIQFLSNLNGMLKTESNDFAQLLLNSLNALEQMIRCAAHSNTC